MSARLVVSCASWGVDYVDTPGNPPWETVIDEIRDAGYRAIELGPLGYLPDEPAALRAVLEERGLRLSCGGLMEPFQDPGELDRLIALAHRTAAVVAGAGGTHFMLIGSLAPEREPLAGNSAAAPRMTADEHARFMRAFETIARIARDDYGLAPLVHPHAGTWIEFEDEIDRLMEHVDGELMSLCLDTGHARYGGADPVALYERYADRIPYVHLKDVDADLLATCVGEGVGFLGAVARGVHPRLGHGSVDYPAFARALERHGFDGWATVEQDRDPHASATSKDDAIANRQFAQGIGFVLDGGEPGA